MLLALAASTPAAAQQGPPLREEIAAALVSVEDGHARPFRWQREPAVLALYFGADWCAPCHAFVPTLVQTRDALRAAGADTEVVYVSLDESEAQMRRYMRRQGMPWPAIDYRRIDRIPALRRLAGRAPPNLVLLDREGNVLASAWHGNRYLGPATVMQRWLELARGGVDAPIPP